MAHNGEDRLELNRIIGGEASPLTLALIYDGAKEAETLAGKGEDVQQALEQLTRAAEAGYAEALFALYKIYNLGSLVKQDEKAALTWLTRAAAAGHETAKRLLPKLEEAAARRKQADDEWKRRQAEAEERTWSNWRIGADDD